MSAVESDTVKSTGCEIEKLAKSDETFVQPFQTLVTTGKNVSVFKHLGRKSVIAQQITKAIPMNEVVQLDRNQVVEETIIKELDETQEFTGNGKGDEFMSSDQAEQNGSVERESESLEDRNGRGITDKSSEEVEVTDELADTAFNQVNEQQESHDEKVKQVDKGDPLLDAYQDIESVATAGTKMNEESDINLIAKSEPNLQSKGIDESLQNPMQHSDYHSSFAFKHLVDDKYSTESIKKLQDDNRSQRVNVPFERAQRFSSNVKLNPTFAIRTLPLSEVPSELHPFLKDYVPVRGEFVSIPGTNMTAVVPQGYAQHYCFSSTNYSSVDKNLGPRQTNDSISGNLYSTKNQIRPNWPTQPTSQAARPTQPTSQATRPTQPTSQAENISQLWNSTHPVLKLNSGGINSITITPLEPFTIDSGNTQPRRIVPTLPKTRNRLKSGPGGRIRGSRPRNYLHAFKKPLNLLPTVKSYYESVNHVSTMPSQICPELSSVESTESPCKNDISVPFGLSLKKSIEESESCSIYGTEQVTPVCSETKVATEFENDKREEILHKLGGMKEEMSNSKEKEPISLIDEEEIIRLAEVSETLNKPHLNCESVGFVCSSPETSPPQKVTEIEVSSDDSRQNFDSKSKYICGSKNEHSLFHKNTNKKKPVSKSIHRSNRISSESETENSFLSNECSSVLGRLDRVPIEILTPDLSSSELEEQSPQTKIEVEVLEQVSTEERRCDATGNGDPWLEEIMEIAEQEGIFIPSMEPVNDDQQLMDAVSSIL